MKTLQTLLAEATGLTVKQEEFYVWTRIPDGGRFINTYKHRKAWGVYRKGKLLYGGFGTGSNTKPQRVVVPTKKAALAFVAGYDAGTELGEFPALKLAHKNRRAGPEQKAYREGVLWGIDIRHR